MPAAQHRRAHWDPAALWARTAQRFPAVPGMQQRRRRPPRPRPRRPGPLRLGPAAAKAPLEPVLPVPAPLALQGPAPRWAPTPAQLPAQAPEQARVQEPASGQALGMPPPRLAQRRWPRSARPGPHPWRPCRCRSWRLRAAGGGAWAPAAHSGQADPRPPLPAGQPRAQGPAAHSAGHPPADVAPGARAPPPRGPCAAARSAASPRRPRRQRCRARCASHGRRRT
mmetsp:Transcript_29669/g.92713  ORF Transcript_29669/g.92713 Transcript_29669/m.92713 type:complete len:225 (-) Transcript_29669:276-950(-)